MKRESATFARGMGYTKMIETNICPGCGYNNHPHHAICRNPDCQKALIKIPAEPLRSCPYCYNCSVPVESDVCFACGKTSEKVPANTEYDITEYNPEDADAIARIFGPLKKEKSDE